MSFTLLLSSKAFEGKETIIHTPMEPLCMAALTSFVPVKTLRANLHDGGIEMWGVSVGLEKLYLYI